MLTNPPDVTYSELVNFYSRSITSCAQLSEELGDKNIRLIITSLKWKGTTSALLDRILYTF